MINFDEEIRKFKPSPEIGDTDQALLEADENDLVDLMMEMMKKDQERP